MADLAFLIQWHYHRATGPVPERVEPELAEQIPLTREAESATAP